MNAVTHVAPTHTIGRVLHSAAAYDFLAWLMLFGREPAFREKILDLAHLAPGEAVLDVGCGTGTLAIRARTRVGAAGAVHGIDASAEMIARAVQKAARAAVEVAFEIAVVEALPFPNAHFDAILSTLMLHHLPRTARAQALSEMSRVLKPSGRVVAVDFGPARQQKHSLIDRFHRHGRIDVAELVTLVGEAGLSVTDSGPMGFKDLHFVIAAAR